MRNQDSKQEFRQWHSRQLYESYAWLALCLLMGVLFFAVFEFIGFGTPGLTPLLTTFALYLIGLMGFMSFRKFWSILSFAQYCADKATCSSCDGYGLFTVRLEDDRMPAICRRCGHRWVIR